MLITVEHHHHAMVKAHAATAIINQQTFLLHLGGLGIHHQGRSLNMFSFREPKGASGTTNRIGTPLYLAVTTPLLT